ncbi:hypothetical protein [Myxococcus eversor]|uniref:hypothetical protein n=1 Tax=Myxococcus eversor TaxID=2709661 RepID=UPI0013D0F555|nr:hypothetical protein [Myxococcus eversor]
MQLKRFARSVVVVAGLMTGCGGEVVGVDEPSQTDSREDALVPCGNEEYQRLFYSEPEMRNVVGEWLCFCGENNRWTYGHATTYSIYTYRNSCDVPLK